MVPAMLNLPLESFPCGGSNATMPDNNASCIHSPLADMGIWSASTVALPFLGEFVEDQEESV